MDYKMNKKYRLVAVLKNSGVCVTLFESDLGVADLMEIYNETTEEMAGLTSQEFLFGEFSAVERGSIAAIQIIET